MKIYKIATKSFQREKDKNAYLIFMHQIYSIPYC